MIRRVITVLSASLFALTAGGSADRSVAAGESANGSGPERLQSACDYGIVCAFQGNVSRAESVFVEILTQGPMDARALTDIGNLKILNGNPRLALSFYDKAALADTNDAGVVLNQATALYLLGDTTASDFTYARGVELAGGYREAANLLGLDVEPDEPEARAADKPRLWKRELLRRLDRAERLIPADTASAPSDSTHARKKRRWIPPRREFTRAAARAGDDAPAAVLYWGR